MGKKAITMPQQDRNAESRENSEEKLYFAYGSNMNPQRMVDRGVRFKRREAARLPGYSFVMNKWIKSNGTAAANIIKDSQSSVHGALYTCSEKGALEMLDKFEGVATNQYVREKVTVYAGQKVVRDVFVYMAVDENCRENLRIHPEYFQHILKGGDILPPEYLHFLHSFRPLLIQNE